MENLSERLPIEFVAQMKQSLGENYSKYIDAINSRPVRAIRVNTEKISVDEFLKKCGFLNKLKKIGYEESGFIFDGDEKIGNSPEHLSGLIYVQEPSSMIPVASSGIEKENRPLKILDLCASPGGKTSQIASKINAKSVVFSNEIIKSRAAVLYSNVERLGLKNVIVINEDPKDLMCFKGYFDYVFVDSPCSGEGMFRKNPETIGQWSMENVALCHDRQKEILTIAEKLVCAGGKLVYSTCTFNLKEDEDIVDWFLDNFNFKLADVDEKIKQTTVNSLSKHENGNFARKFYPFCGDGEGQFVAVFENYDEDRKNDLYSKKHYLSINQIGQSEKKLVDEFSKSSLKRDFDWRELYRVGDNIFLAPSGFDGEMQTALENLRLLSIGIKLGSIEKNRFEPNHNAFVALEDLFLNKIELDDEKFQKYLHGEELQSELNKNCYAVVSKNGFSVGGVKISGGKLKNLYPKGMRI